MTTPTPQEAPGQWTVEKEISPLKFCHWLARIVERWNDAIVPDVVDVPVTFLHYDLLPYLASLQKPAPYLITVELNRTFFLSAMMQYPAGTVGTISVQIFPLEGGCRLVIETAAINLERFVLTLDELPDMRQAVQGHREGEKLDTGQAVQGHRGGEKEWAEIEEIRGQPVSPETVRKYHTLALTTSLSANAIQNRLHTTTDTYYQYCKKYIGETPVDMASRAQKIKQKKWPPAE